jgi:glycosyltransferase involved in cell wall biosynthesis
MSPVESIAAGKPVIGVDEGGVCESVVDGVGGVLLNSADFNADRLVHAVTSVAKLRASQKEMSRFGTITRQQFINELTMNG